MYDVTFYRLTVPCLSRDDPSPRPKSGGQSFPSRTFNRGEVVGSRWVCLWTVDLTFDWTGWSFPRVMKWTGVDDRLTWSTTSIRLPLFLSFSVSTFLSVYSPSFTLVHSLSLSLFLSVSLSFSVSLSVSLSCNTYISTFSFVAILHSTVKSEKDFL